ncbi:hypothetical protein [Pelagibaculum spongiae]|uniref:Uncharacterized protein n=1 Tax=Pelagibaculum spongiae TaxID=2080658 RepID=A0A2V1H074_9GAMM|nr:hypothetical protein [Pelagibaculum spongiae]PVZ68393.1 hypothetical protein DC094_14035 [Pelagibaculum spongiae]
MDSPFKYPVAKIREKREGFMRNITSEELFPGDILIQTRKNCTSAANIPPAAFHSMLWCCLGHTDSRPVIHSVLPSENFQYNGVLQQNASSYIKKHPCYIIRCNDSELADYAKNYAKIWAISTDGSIEEYLLQKDRIKRKKEIRNSMDDPDTPLLTPFGISSIEKRSLDKEKNIWGTSAILKSYQAYIRGESKISLSENIGVYCIQFILCCYQAAAIKKSISNGSMKLPIELQIRAMHDKRFSSKNLALTTEVLKYSNEISQEIPISLQHYAKRCYLEDVLKILLSEDLFSLVGRLN